MQMKSDGIQGLETAETVMWSTSISFSHLRHLLTRNSSFHKLRENRLAGAGRGKETAAIILQTEGEWPSIGW
jgi:hypothetical protein